MEPTIEVEFTTRELRVLAKYIGTSLDVIAKKLERLDPSHRVYADTAEQFTLLASALDVIRDAQLEALGGEEVTA